MGNINIYKYNINALLIQDRFGAQENFKSRYI